MRLDDVIKLVVEYLKLASKEKKEEARKELTDFINSSNIYRQRAYNEREVEVKNLLSQLDGEYRDNRPDEKQEQGGFSLIYKNWPLISVILVFLAVVVLLVIRRGGKGTKLKLAKK